MRGINKTLFKSRQEDEEATLNGQDDTNQSKIGKLTSKLATSLTPTHKKSISIPTELSDDPAAFTFAAISPIFTFNRKDLDYEDFRIPKQHLTAYFWPKYQYRVNCALFTLGNLEQVGRHLRETFVRGRLNLVRTIIGEPSHRDHLPDGLEDGGIEDSHRAQKENEMSIALVVEQRLTFFDGEMEEERHSQMIGIFRMRRGRLVAGDLTAESIGNIHLTNDIGDIDCCIA